MHSWSLKAAAFFMIPFFFALSKVSWDSEHEVWAGTTGAVLTLGLQDILENLQPTFRPFHYFQSGSWQVQWQFLHEALEKSGPALVLVSVKCKWKGNLGQGAFLTPLLTKAHWDLKNMSKSFIVFLSFFSMLYTGSGQIVHPCLKAAARQEPRHKQQPALAASRLESASTGNSSREGKHGMGKRRKWSKREKDLPVRDVNPFILGHADAVPSSEVLKWPLKKNPEQRKSQFSQRETEREREENPAE